MSGDLGEFFSLIGKAKKEKEDEFRSLVGNVDIDSMFSQVKVSIEEDKKKKQKEEKQIKALESWLFAEPKKKEEPIEVTQSPIIGEDTTNYEEWIEEDVKEREEEVVEEPTEEITEKVEVEDTVDHALKILETIKSKEEVRENLGDPEILKIRRELEYLKNLVNAQGGGGEVNLRYLDDIVGIATNLSAYDGMYLGIDVSNTSQPFKFSTVSAGGGSGDYASVAGIATYATTAGIATYATTAGIATYATTAGVATESQGLTGTPDITVRNVSVTGLTTFSGTTTLESTKYLQLKDSTNIIGHNGSNNLFRFTDSLQFRGDTLFFQEYDGTEYMRLSEQFGVQLKHQGSTKLQIESDGITITGTINDHTIPSGSGTFALTSDIPTNNNELTNGAGYITTSFTNTNQLTNGAGFITASDDITGTASGLSGTPNITVGIVTATSAIVGSAVTINSSGLNVAGVITATTFVGSLTGSASSLSGVSSSFLLDYNNFTNTPTIPTNNNQLTNGAGYITTSFTNTNQLTNGAGFITASDNITGTAAGLSGSPDIGVQNIVGVAATFTGDLTVEGTFSYEDITNVDSIGFATFRKGIEVQGAGSTTTTLNVTGVSTLGIVTSSSIFSTGIITATTFVGNLTGTATTATNLADGANITTGTINDDRLPDLITSNINIITGVSTVGTLDVVNVVADNLSVSGVSTFSDDISIADKIIHTGDTDTAIRFPDADTFTVETAGSERVRISAGGSVGIGTDNPSQKLDVNGDIRLRGAIYDSLNSVGSVNQILVSNAGAGVTWTDVSGIPVGDANTLDGLNSTQFLRSDVADTKSGITTFSDDVILQSNLNVTGVSTFAADTNFQNVSVGGTLSLSGAGSQFFAYNEDTIKVKFANWYSSNDRQYGMGQLWFETWFAAIDNNPTLRDNRRIGFYLEEPNNGSSDSGGTSNIHPTNDRMHIDINGVFVRDNLEVSGGANIVGVVTATTFVGDGVTLNNGFITTGVSTTTATDQTSIDSFSASTYRSAKYNVQITRGSEYQTTEISVIHDGSDSYGTEYATIKTGATLATFSTDVSGGNVRLLATPSSATSTVFKLFRTTTEA